MFWIIDNGCTVEVIESESRPPGDYATQAFTGREIIGPFKTYDNAYAYAEELSNIPF